MNEGKFIVYIRNRIYEQVRKLWPAFHKDPQLTNH
jgi:hypothetical protein